MVFNMPPHNNRKFPLYFLWKMYTEFMLRKHVNIILCVCVCVCVFNLSLLLNPLPHYDPYYMFYRISFPSLQFPPPLPLSSNTSYSSSNIPYLLFHSPILSLIKPSPTSSPPPYPPFSPQIYSILLGP